MQHAAPQPAPQLLRAGEVARTLGVSKQTVYRWTWEGRIAHVRLASSVRIPASEVQRVLIEGIQ